MNLVTQMRTDPAGSLVVRAWEVPDDLELDPGPLWVEQETPALPSFQPSLPWAR